MWPLALYELGLAANGVLNHYAGPIVRLQDQNPFANYQLTGTDKCVLGGVVGVLLFSGGLYAASRVLLSLSSRKPEPSQPTQQKEGWGMTVYDMHGNPSIVNVNRIDGPSGVLDRVDESYLFQMTAKTYWRNEEMRKYMGRIQGARSKLKAPGYIPERKRFAIIAQMISDERQLCALRKINISLMPSKQPPEHTDWVKYYERQCFGPRKK
ncbi:hypothetical protein A3K63_04580 [Candidatus Micrarchaeota archaeon RBG_16_49_10]|nr:MAG: hypothetical protein A3K63_04580 [Candidatus Micrarchaeota archaeon RBG_16_49_10]